MTEEASVLRTSCLPGVVAAVEWNLNRGARSVRLFEVGKLYLQSDGKFAEAAVLALAASGAVSELSAHVAKRDVNFFDLKGDIEVLLGRFASSELSFQAGDGVESSHYHPGRWARAVMDGETVARFGELHPRLAAARKLRRPVLVAEVFLEHLWKYGLRQPRYQPVPKVPAVDRDLSLLVADDVPFERIVRVARSLNLPALASIEPVEVLRGGPIAAGKYGLLLRLVFQRADETLSDAAVNEWSRAIAVAFEKELGAVLRS